MAKIDSESRPELGRARRGSVRCVGKSQAHRRRVRRGTRGEAGAGAMGGARRGRVGGRGGAKRGACGGRWVRWGEYSGCRSEAGAEVSG